MEGVFLCTTLWFTCRSPSAACVAVSVLIAAKRAHHTRNAVLDVLGTPDRAPDERDEVQLAGHVG